MANQMHPLEVVLRPMITEKATELGGVNKYMFEVRRDANKTQIKEAVQKGFDVKVESVNVEQSILGRMLGYGSIIVIGTGGTTEVFGKIADPMEFRRQFQSRQV